MRRVLSVFVAIVICLCLAVAVSADTFAPSVTAKPAPEVVRVENKPVVEVKDEAGNVVTSTKIVNLVVTPVSAVMNEEAKDLPQENAEALKKAYEELSDKTVDIATVVEGMEEVLKEQKVESSKLVVKDLFDVSVHDEAFVEYLNQEGHTIDVAFQADIQEGQFVTVAVYKDGKWILAKNVVVGEDGVVIATLECLGTVAIIVA